MKFRKKPVVIEAWRWKGPATNESWQEFLADNGLPKTCSTRRPGDKDAKGIVRTLEGDILCSVGDWIIKGVEGELYPCKDRIFQKTYEPVED